MKTTILLTFSFLFSMDSNTDAIEWRRLFKAAAEDEISANKLLVKTTSTPENNAVAICYKGSAYMMLARHKFNPVEKYSLFVKGRKLMEEAIRMDPWAAEIRFVRFTIQTNLPAFLGYSGNIAEDKEVLISQWKNIPDKDLLNRIREYMLSSSHCTLPEKRIFN